MARLVFATRLVMALVAALVIGTLSIARPALAVQPDEILSDKKLEARARALSAELRCLVCQNQSIDDSNAPLARDLRLLVRERLQKGDSDDEVLDFVVSRYGEFALLRPRFGLHTLLLWMTPILALLASGVLLVRQMKGGKAASAGAASAGAASVEAALSADEQARLDKLLKEEGA